ncbi:MAG: hypothetical protein SOX04_00150 [Eubacteriales bacterium]|nr:hypothetical protein [Christensenellaceae bacterium]MDY3240949.1 hypothetical protein [Eubacteriales bacterium]
MDYDAIIVEVLTRIKTLEDKVMKIEAEQTIKTPENNAKISTSEIRAYINNLKKISADKGEKALILTARDIHGALHLKERYPMVCNAMRQAMSECDEIIYSPQSGFSSTLKIKYYL